MGKKVMTLEEKTEILSHAIEILKSGNKPIIDAFEAKVNAILKMVRVQKKDRKRDRKKIKRKGR